MLAFLSYLVVLILMAEPVVTKDMPKCRNMVVPCATAISAPTQLNIPPLQSNVKRNLERNYWHILYLLCTSTVLASLLRLFAWVTCLSVQWATPIFHHYCHAVLFVIMCITTASAILTSSVFPGQRISTALNFLFIQNFVSSRHQHLLFNQQQL